DPARGPLDRDFNRLLEGASFLDEMIGEEPESPALHEDGCLVVYRAIREVEEEPARDAVPANHLNQFTARQLPSLQRTEDQEAVGHTFGITNRNLLGGQGPGPQRNSRREKQREQ